jgi:hypothetical protein
VFFGPDTPIGIQTGYSAMIAGHTSPNSAHAPFSTIDLIGNIRRMKDGVKGSNICSESFFVDFNITEDGKGDEAFSVDNDLSFEAF